VRAADGICIRLIALDELRRTPKEFLYELVVVDFSGQKIFSTNENFFFST
jgi:hypothetical protein